MLLLRHLLELILTDILLILFILFEVSLFLLHLLLFIVLLAALPSLLLLALFKLSQRLFPRLPLLLIDLGLLLLFLLLDQSLRLLIELNGLSEPGIVILVLLALHMILHDLLILEDLLAYLAPVLLHSHLLILTPGNRLLFFESVPLSNVLPVLPQLLLLLLPLP